MHEATEPRVPSSYVEVITSKILRSTPWYMRNICHKWPRICLICRNHNLVLSSFMTWVCNKSNMTGATCGAGTAYSSGTVSSGVRVVRSLVVCVAFYRSLVCPFFLFGHCVVCLSSIYSFCLAHWHLQTFQNTFIFRLTSCHIRKRYPLGLYQN